MSSQSINTSQWSHYFEITCDSSLVSEVPDAWRFPLSLAPESFWDVVNGTDGRDIRVVIGNTAYSFGLENFREGVGFNYGSLLFDGTAGSTSSDTTWRVYAGNASATMPGDSDTLGINNVWDGSTTAAYRFSSTPDSTAPQLDDLTGNGNDGTTSGSMELADKFVGPNDQYAWNFDGTNDRVDIGELATQTKYTISLWVRYPNSWNAANEYETIISQGWIHSGTDFEFAVARRLNATASNRTFAFTPNRDQLFTAWKHRRLTHWHRSTHGPIWFAPGKTVHRKST